MNVLNEFVQKVLNIIYYLCKVENKNQLRYDNADKNNRQSSPPCILLLSPRHFQIYKYKGEL